MSQSLFDLTGRVALVTGGSKGLGKAMARVFAEHGANIVISSRHEAELKLKAAEVNPPILNWIWISPTDALATPVVSVLLVHTLHERLTLLALAVTVQ